MGNRAVITAQGSQSGIYLHWNGGNESVRAFLRVAKDLGVRDPAGDPGYFLARTAQIIGNFFGGTTSVGVGALSELDCDNGDNGTYTVAGGFEIVKRSKYNSTAPGDKAYEFRVYRDALKANHSFFKRAYGDKLPPQAALIKQAAKALGVDVAALDAADRAKRIEQLQAARDAYKGAAPFTSTSDGRELAKLLTAAANAVRVTRPEVQS
jgi:hypothetical protein